MNPGEYDTKIIILKKESDEASDDTLSNSFDWVPFCEKWAKQIRFQGAAQTMGTADANLIKRVFEIRASSNIDNTCRVKWNGSTYEIEDVDDSLKRKTGLIRITIKKVVNS